jgi:hypothetical protein
MHRVSQELGKLCTPKGDFEISFDTRVMTLGVPGMKAEKDFWDWFVRHEPELFGFRADREDERESVFDELTAQLQKVHPDLAFEFGPNAVKREFVISAGGIKGAFSSVKSLVGAAPILDRWQITAFRPRRNPINVVEFRGKRVDPRDVQFTLLSNENMPGVRLFIPGYKESDSELKTIGYLLLDESLGEYDVETHLGLIEMLSPDTRTDGQRHPFPELPRQFDELVASLWPTIEN